MLDYLKLIQPLIQPVWKWVLRVKLRREDTRSAGLEEIAKLLHYRPENLEALYVEPDCQDVPPANSQKDDEKTPKSPLKKEIDRFVEKKAAGLHDKVFIVLADAGMGKTSLLAMLKLRHIKGSWARGKNCELRKLGPRTLEDIGAIEYSSNTILLLDSLDEDPKAFGRVKARLKEILQVSKDFEKVILTSRPQFLPDLKRDQMNSSEYVVIGEYVCKCKHLSFFDDTKVAQYLDKKYRKGSFGLLESPQGEIENAKQIIGLMGHLQCRPLLLSYIDRFKDPKSILKNASEYSTYCALVNSWLRWEGGKDEVSVKMRKKSGKRRIDKKELREACIIIAVWMQMHNRDTISGYELDELKKTEIAKIGSVRQIKRLDLKGRSLLNKNTDREYCFAHSSLQEFCAAQYIIEKQPFKFEGKIRVTDQIAKFVVESGKLNPELDPSVLDLSQIDHVKKTRQKKTCQGMDFVYIPQDAFYIGTPVGEAARDADGNESRHLVLLTQGFYMQTTPVTQAQWEAMMGENPSLFRGDERPIENVSWEDAHTFIDKLNQREGGDVFNLPSEAQWEYACRAGTQSRFYTGDTDADLDRSGWYDRNSNEATHPVGEKEPNAFGLYDMHGNVDEWVEDDWHDEYKDAPIDGSAWIDEPRGAFRVIRGGSWYDAARRCRSASRDKVEPDAHHRLVGFRLVLLRGL